MTYCDLIRHTAYPQEAGCGACRSHPGSTVQPGPPGSPGHDPGTIMVNISERHIVREKT